MKKIVRLSLCIYVLTSAVIISGFLLLLFYPREGKIAIVSEKIRGESRHYVKTTCLIKFAALIERYNCYKTWIAALTMSDKEGESISDEEKIIKVFNWIKDYPILSELQEKFPGKFIHIEQHEYDNLIKQYGAVVEKTLTFCNLMVISGFPASPVYSGNNGIVIVKVAPQKFLYFDFANKRIINSEKIHDVDKKKWIERLDELDTNSKGFSNKEHLHGYENIPLCRLKYELLNSKESNYLLSDDPPPYLREVGPTD